MKASDLTRELRRIARREVPNGEPNLWPTIRQQLERAGASSESHRPGADLSTSYVWHADTPRRRRYGTLPAAMAGTLVLVLLVAGLALALGNRGDDKTPVGLGSARRTTTSATPDATPAAVWPNDGKLTIPLSPVGSAGISGQVTAQILPGGDLSLRIGVSDATDILVWHVVPESCAHAPTGPSIVRGDQDLIAPFSQTGLSVSFIPAAATHQQIAVAGLRFADGSPVACAMIPPIPIGFNPHFAAASDVPATCPVTLPGATLFTPPSEQGAPPNAIYGEYWYGNPKLWTALPLDGVWDGGKSFWWSQGYSAFAEQQPALTVAAKRLDGPGSAVADRATNGIGDTGNFMLVGVDFPTTGCWQVSGTYKGETVTFVVWTSDPFHGGEPESTPTTSGTPIPSIDVPSATPTPISSVLTCSNLLILTRFIDAFNVNDQATLTAMPPETALGGNRWLAAVTTSHLNLMNGNVLAMTRDDFLSYVAARHQQHEQLSFDGVLETTQANTVPISENVVIQIGRTADDIGVEHVKAVVSLSCAAQMVTAWSVGDTLDTGGTIVPTGEDLISQTLHARNLHVNDIALTGGICPVDLPHTVDPSLGPALGNGPLYVVMGQADENGVNHFRGNNVDDGWYYFKVIWTSDPSYQGPVLVRGMQIDGSAEMRFGGSNPPDSEFYIAPHGDPVTYTRVNAPGCYVYQVDGINFSELIVTSFQP